MDLLLNRRRMLMAQGGEPEPQYITDGLIFRVDGKLAQGGTVKELVNDVTFSANSSANISFHDNAIDLNGGSFVSTNAAVLLDSNANYTIEVCFSPSAMSANGVIFISGANASGTYYPMVILTTGGGLTFAGRAGAGYVAGVTVGSKNTVSMNQARGIKNGTAMTTTSAIYLANSARTIIGARRNSTTYNSQFYGKIYAIRVYSRQLTEYEMKYNQWVDDQRFGLGLGLVEPTNA